jgi:hypothetical protein
MQAAATIAVASDDHVGSPLGRGVGGGAESR